MSLPEVKGLLTDAGLADVAQACGLLIQYQDASMTAAFNSKTVTPEGAQHGDQVMAFLYRTRQWAASVLSERLGHTVSTDVQRRDADYFMQDDNLAALIAACNVMIGYIDVATANADELEALNPGHIEASDELLGWIYGTRQAAENMLAERIDIQERN
ncbi:MAG: hypothetical protein KJ060_08105 [Candidatus Hydrogenedentes bacterium]|nr:hypothetical protein [Candidatus Hydrogenedentota bacterium]